MNQLRRRRSEWRAACDAGWLCALALVVGCGPGTQTPRPAAAPTKTTQVKGATAAQRQATAPDPVQPLDQALTLARRSLETLDEVEDYVCEFVKRERVDGELLDEERLEMKLRHKPFSVYMRFLEPKALADQEAIYVEGRNDGKLLAHTNGLKGQLFGTLELHPDGFLAMRDNRYPITNAGMKNLVTLLLQLGERRDLLKDCRVEFNDDGEIDGRDCLLIEISNPRPVGEFHLAKAKIWLDRERNVPLGFESWEWPADGGEPVLAESYRYEKLKFDQGLTDRDFDPANPDYSFP
ncbi:MAG TPA: DUF1571 domain-containing protein [Pirellulales bacterium]|nr:DUF1571 domain-containing protein [Pirellulales bacterium]